MDKIPKRFLQDLKLVRDGLSVAYNHHLERYQIFYTDPRNGMKRLVFTVENQDRTYRPLDMRTIIKLQTEVCWEWVDKYPSVDELSNFIVSQLQERDDKKDRLRTEFLKWWNKDHRSLWKKALENAQRGIFSMPEQTERKIIIA